MNLGGVFPGRVIFSLATSLKKAIAVDLLPIESSAAFPHPSIDIRQRPSMQSSMIDVTSPFGSILSRRDRIVRKLATKALNIAGLVQKQLLQSFALAWLDPERCTVGEPRWLGQSEIQSVVHLRSRCPSSPCPTRPVSLGGVVW